MVTHSLSLFRLSYTLLFAIYFTFAEDSATSNLFLRGIKATLYHIVSFNPMAGVATDLVDRNSRGCIVEDEWEVGLKSRRGVAIPRLVSRDYGDSSETCSLAIGGFFL